MAVLSLLAPACLTTRLLRGTVSLVTAPVRLAMASAEILVEDLREALRSEPPPETARPFAPPAEGLTPSVTRTARARRRQIRDPRPPVPLPGLFDPGGEPWPRRPQRPA